MEADLENLSIYEERKEGGRTYYIRRHEGIAPGVGPFSDIFTEETVDFLEGEPEAQVYAGVQSRGLLGDLSHGLFEGVIYDFEVAPREDGPYRLGDGPGPEVRDEDLQTTVEAGHHYTPEEIIEKGLEEIEEEMQD